MKTGDWIDLLARNAGPAPRAVAARRLWPAAAIVRTVRAASIRLAALMSSL